MEKSIHPFKVRLLTDFQSKVLQQMLGSDTDAEKLVAVRSAELRWLS